MKEKLDQTFRKLIIKTIDSQYHVNNNRVTEIDDLGNTLFPNELSEYIESVFDIGEDWAEYITYNWLFENGFKNIHANWKPFEMFSGYLDSTSHTFGGNFEDNNIVLGGSQLTLDYNTYPTISAGTLTVSSDVTNTIVVGSNNTVTTSDTVVIGNNNTITTSGTMSGTCLTNYFLSCDVATDSCVTIQMHPDGTHEYVNH